MQVSTSIKVRDHVDRLLPLDSIKKEVVVKIQSLKSIGIIPWEFFTYFYLNG
jgi:hypothetical protein